MAYVEYVKNPLTGRMIVVGGATYKKLESEIGKSRASRLKRTRGPSPKTKAKRNRAERQKMLERRTMKKTGPITQKRTKQLPKAKPASLKKTYQSTPRTRKAKRKTLKKEMTNKGKGRGKRTRGWAAASPQRGKERHELMEKCGPSCFLQPKTEGFPICAALRTKQGCAVDCRGITAAKVRAAQWNHPKIVKKATKMEKRYKC